MIIFIHHPILNQGHNFRFSWQNLLSLLLAAGKRFR